MKKRKRRIREIKERKEKLIEKEVEKEVKETGRERNLIELWKESLLKPKETFVREKEGKKANFWQGIKLLIIGLLIFGVVYALKVLVAGPTTPDEVILAKEYGSSILIIAPVMTIISGLITGIILNGLEFGIARLIGGIGKFGQQFYITSLFTSIIIILNILTFIPYIGDLIGFVILIFSLYLLTIALKEVHEISTWKSIFVWLVAGIILVVIMFLLTPAYG